MLINLEDVIFEEFCDNDCPDRGIKKMYERYGRRCPNCVAESYHYWLKDRFNTRSKDNTKEGKLCV